MYYTRRTMREAVEAMPHVRRIQAEARSSDEDAAIQVFLSHSHHDKFNTDLVHQAKRILGDQHVRLWVDSEDSTMPEYTSPETAELLKERIEEFGKFIMLATVYALQSPWCGWELGIADSMIGMDNVVVWPVGSRRIREHLKCGHRMVTGGSRSLTGSMISHSLLCARGSARLPEVRARKPGLAYAAPFAGGRTRSKRRPARLHAACTRDSEGKPHARSDKAQAFLESRDQTAQRHQLVALLIPPLPEFVFAGVRLRVNFRNGVGWHWWHSVTEPRQSRKPRRMVT